MPKKARRYTKVNPLHIKSCPFTRRDDSPQYKAWHAAILKRDKYQCKWPACQVKRKLQCHHIKKWSSFPYLRYNIGNGITLCNKHHQAVKGKEEQYERLFLESLIKIEDKIKLAQALKEENGEENICDNSGHEGTTSLEF